MKKLFFAFSLMLMAACNFTNNGGINVSSCDGVDALEVDSFEVVDTLAIDSLVIDSIN